MVLYSYIIFPRCPLIFRLDFRRILTYFFLPQGKTSFFYLFSNDWEFISSEKIKGILYPGIIFARHDFPINFYSVNNMISHTIREVRSFTSGQQSKALI